MITRRYPWQSFKDGITYHDYHFNGMQLNIAKEHKYDMVYQHYGSLLLVRTDVEYVWFDPLIDESLIESTSGVVFDNSILAARPTQSVGSITWKPIDLQRPATLLELCWDAKVPEGSSVITRVSVDGGQSWIDVENGTPITLSGNQFVRLQVTLAGENESSRPVLNHIGLFWS